MRDHFKAMGCLVIRSAGSHTPVDLVVIPPKHLKTLYHGPQLVQCKTDGKLSETEKQELIQLAHDYACEAILASLVDNPNGQGKIIKETVLWA